MLPLQTIQKSEEKQPEHTFLNIYDNFALFFFQVFLPGVEAIEGDLCYGQHLVDWCNELQVYPYTSKVAPRYHLKSTVHLGLLAWKAFRMDKTFNEWLFLGFRKDLAGYQLKRLKRYMTRMPEFSEYESMTPADTIIHIKDKNGKEFLCEPDGVFSANRGRHPDGMIADDILRDPEVKLDISQIVKIETFFKEEFEHMPKEELHVIGTRQDYEDLFKYLHQSEKYHSREYTAVTNFKDKTSLWPEKYSYEYLMQLKLNIGDKAFNKEFMCKPVRSEEGYFLQEDLDDVICSRLRNRKIREVLTLNEYCYGGFDIGKKRHPSHLSVYGKNRRHEPVQLLSLWMDHWDYKDQLETCKKVITNFKLQRLLYDDTRAEFEGFNEIGELPGEMEGVNFTKKKKFEMAATFEKGVRSKKMKMVDDARQKRQILNVDNDLKSMETSEGHGDSFWSNALAFEAMQEGGGQIMWM